ncbi:heparan-alpha-glucosaminide N-acetyltransferase domain-containing protein [Dyadobacter sp. BHUBP1]|uniref:heparan-alpha-glucosaminide N-acetyltransferase domain-containing protein n=1 Tax=Dyadobacter sp. BHUBP1 TaxID=3424178 RepID=UPI003D3411E6
MPPSFPSFRLDSIDVFRAVTMFLMIFVNDLWSLEDIPDWLRHSKAAEDAMGLSDVVFPGFLFIVGLSIPFAIANRKKKGDSDALIIRHIAERTFALLLMGIFIVNYENIAGEAMVISKHVWEIGMVIAFFLIWNVYPSNPGKKGFYTALKVAGYLLLAGLALIYKGGDPANPSWMETHWYGILGLIGWSYLLGALAYLPSRDRLTWAVGGWLFFVLFNLADFAGVLDLLNPVKEYVWIVGSGSMPAFVMGGVVASVIYRNRISRNSAGTTYLIILVVLGLIALAYGFGTRPFWGISKIRATPAWVGICSGISFLAFAFLFWLVDLKNIKNWANIIRPAGTATLTCYLIPYIWYAVITLAGISLPMYLRTGMIGLVKSACFSLLVILLTGAINKVGIKLKI